MEVSVRVVGGDSHHFEFEGETYADVLEAVGFHPQEATVLVDGRPVPGDQEVEHPELQVLRLISGG